MTDFKTVKSQTSYAIGDDRFITMIEEFNFNKKLLGYDTNTPAKIDVYFMDENMSMSDKKEKFIIECQKNISLGLEFVGSNFLINHHDQITWTDRSILKFLNTNFKLMGYEVGLENTDYKNKVGVPVGLMKLQMLSCCLNRSDMMGFTHYNPEIIDKWVKKNKSKFIGKCLGSLNEEEWEIISNNNAGVYVNNFFRNDMEESYEMNKYCLEQMTEEEKNKQVDKLDNLLWFWRGEF